MTSVSDKENRLLSITAIRNSFYKYFAELLIYNFEPGFKWKNFSSFFKRVFR